MDTSWRHHGNVIETSWRHGDMETERLTVETWTWRHRAWTWRHEAWTWRHQTENESPADFP